MRIEERDCLRVFPVKREKIRNPLEPPFNILWRILIIPQNFLGYFYHP
jgi:hypothetical protein